MAVHISLLWTCIVYLRLSRRPKASREVRRLATWIPWAVDHSARGSMKSAANCAFSCKLQDTNIDILNANSGPGLSLWPHLSEGW